MGTRMNTTLTVRDLRIDLDRVRVWRGDEVVTQLTPTEFRILSALANSCGKVVSASQLMEAGKGCPQPNPVKAQDEVRVYIRRLRRKLGDGVIANVRGFGYVIDEVGG